MNKKSIRMRRYQIISLCIIFMFIYSSIPLNFLFGKIPFLSDQTHSGISRDISSNPNNANGLPTFENLVLWLSFDDPYYIGKDGSRNNRNAYSNYVDHYLDDERGSVANFYDPSSILTLQDFIPLGIEANWTVMTWYREFISEPSNLDRTLLMSYQSDSTYNLIGAYRNTPPNNYNFFTSGRRSDSSIGTNFMSPITNVKNYGSEWHHITIVGNRSTTTFFLDGIQLGFAEANIHLDIYNIGNYRGQQRRFAQFLDDFRVYDTDLSVSAIQDIYSKTKNPTIPWYQKDGIQYQYRFQMDVETSLETNANAPLSQKINFTDQLANMRFDASLDPSSIKLVEYDIMNANYLNVESPTFILDPDANLTTNATGTLTWIKNGSVPTPQFSANNGYINNWVIINRKTNANYQLSGNYANVNPNRQYSAGQTSYWIGGTTSAEQLVWNEYSSPFNDYINFTNAFGEAELNWFGYAQSFIYIPQDYNTAFAQFYFTWGDSNSISISLDGYALPLISETISARSVDSFFYRHRYDLNGITEGWHSIMILLRNSNTTTEAIPNWGFKLQISEQQVIESPITPMQIASSCPFERRTYFIYFNTTSAPIAKYNNEFFGNLAFMNNTSQIGISKINIYPPEYKEYKELIQNINNAPWWNSDWSFRVLANVSAPAYNYYYCNHLLEAHLNFTELLESVNASKNFDENSIQVMEYDEYCSNWREIPYQFNKDNSYDPSYNATGLLSWVMDGKTTLSRTRFFFIYFDNAEFGIKTLPDYSSLSNLSYTQNGTNDYTVENDKIRFSIKEGAPPIGFYEDHIYSVYDKRTHKNLLNPNSNLGWALTAWDFGGVTQTSPFFYGLTNLEIERTGVIQIKLRMTFDSANFLYERFYTLNYLDDTIRIDHTITAKVAISAGGYWDFKTDWFQSDVNRAIGIGGFDFSRKGVSVANSSLDKSREFTSNDIIETFSILTSSNVNQYEKLMEHAWHATWVENESYGVGTIWSQGKTSGNVNLWRPSYLSQLDLADNGLATIFRIVPLASTLNVNQKFSFSMYGHVFNHNNGLITKARAKGLQNAPLLTLGVHPSSASPKPTINLNSPINSSYINAVETIELTVNNATSMWYSWNGGVNSTLSGSISNPGTNGMHFLDVWATDTKAYLVHEAFIFTVDIDNPTITVNSPSGEYYHTQPNIDVDFSDNIMLAIAQYKVDVYGEWIDIFTTDQGTFYNGDFLLEAVVWASLSAGLYTVYFRVYDKANNTNSSVVSWQFYKEILTTPTPPENLIAISGDNNVTLSWLAPLSDGGSPIYEYSIYRSTSSGGGYINIGTNTSALEFFDETAMNDITYYYIITANNSVGESAFSAEVNCTPSSFKTAPTPPQNLEVYLGLNNITLAWMVPVSDGGSEILGYNIYRSTTSGYDYIFQGTNTTTLEFYDITAEYSITYFYVITAINSYGESGYSNEVSFRLEALSNDLPHPPELRLLSSNPSATGEIDLEWNFVEGALYYRLYRSTSPIYGTMGLIPIASQANNNFQDRRTEAGLYFYAVVAINNSGSSNISNTVNVSVVFPESVQPKPEPSEIHNPFQIGGYYIIYIWVSTTFIIALKIYRTRRNQP